MKKAINAVLLLVLIWSVVFTINNTNKERSMTGEKTAEELAKINFKRPSFTLEGIDGKEYSTNDVSTPLVINFWASWCGPCKIEAPELVKLYQKYNNKVQIYAVNTTANDSEEEASYFAESYGFKFPVLLDKNNAISNKYNVLAIPTTYFVNKDGVIVDQILGYGGEKALEEKFKNLMDVKE